MAKMASIFNSQCCAIIRVPDFCGGHEDELWWFNTPAEMQECFNNLPAFHYIEWSGKIYQLLKEADNIIMTGHLERFHETPKDYEWTVREELARM